MDGVNNGIFPEKPLCCNKYTPMAATCLKTMDGVNKGIFPEKPLRCNKYSPMAATCLKTMDGVNKGIFPEKPTCCNKSSPITAKCYSANKTAIKTEVNPTTLSCWPCNRSKTLASIIITRYRTVAQIWWTTHTQNTSRLDADSPATYTDPSFPINMLPALMSLWSKSKLRNNHSIKKLLNLIA